MLTARARIMVLVLKQLHRNLRRNHFNICKIVRLFLKLSTLDDCVVGERNYGASVNLCHHLWGFLLLLQFSIDEDTEKAVSVYHFSVHVAVLEKTKQAFIFCTSSFNYVSLFTTEVLCNLSYSCDVTIIYFLNISIECF